MGAQSWAAPTGTYTTVLDLKNMTVTLSVPSSVTDIVAEGDDTPAVYYNLMGYASTTPPPESTSCAAVTKLQKNL